MIRAQLMKSDLQLSQVSQVTTTTSAAFDMLNCDFAVLDIIFGIRKDSTTVATSLSVLDCDTTVVTSHVTVVADQSITPGATVKLTRYMVGKPRRRYLRLVSTPGTVATGDAINITAILHKFRNREDASAASELVATTDSVVTVG